MKNSFKQLTVLFMAVGFGMGSFEIRAQVKKEERIAPDKLVLLSFLKHYVEIGVKQRPLIPLPIFRRFYVSTVLGALKLFDNWTALHENDELGSMVTKGKSLAVEHDAWCSAKNPAPLVIQIRPNEVSEKEEKDILEHVSRMVREYVQRVKSPSAPFSLVNPGTSLFGEALCSAELDSVFDEFEKVWKTVN